MFEVSDETDANSAGVVEGMAGVSTMQLLFPAERGFDRSVGHSIAVANYEVISDAFPGVAVGVFAAKVLLMD